MSFKSFLSTVGKDFKKGLDYVLKLEPAAEAALTIVDPPVAALVHLTTATIVATEQKFAAIGEQSGTGAQKAAQVIQIIGPTAKAVLSPYGLTVDDEYLHKVIDPIVALLNALPAVAVVAGNAGLQAPVAPAA